MKKEIEFGREQTKRWEKLAHYWELRYMALDHEVAAASYKRSAESLFPTAEGIPDT